MHCARFLLFFPLLVACGPSDIARWIVSPPPETLTLTYPDTALGRVVHGDGQLTEYVRRIFQDSKGRYWFGSNGNGIYQYDGSALRVFSTVDGLAGGQITGVLEDLNGNIWMTTDGGVSRFDGNTIVSYTTKDGLPNNGCWSIFMAQDGSIWVGTAAGPARYDGTRFIPLVLLNDDAAREAQVHWVSCITQDRAGDLWFATREAGAFRYDGRSFPRPAITQGLDDDELACILVDSKDRRWVSSMNAGLVQQDKGVVKPISAPNEIGNNEVWTVMEDRDGDIWFSSEGFGVYRYNGTTLRNYAAAAGLGVRAVQTIYQDQEGRMWFGGGGGLYRLEGDSMIHVKRNGPWR